MQKMSAAPLTLCPACNNENFKKQLTAPGFQLKGSGWYATDFKGGTPAAAAAQSEPADKPAQPAQQSTESPPCQGGAGACPAPSCN